MRGAMRALDLPETEAPHLGVSLGGVEVEGIVFVRATSPSSVLALPEMEAPHLGVSSGGVDVDGGFAKVAGNSRLHSLLPAPTL